MSTLACMLVDSHNRVINYLRLAVTDKCNLRCHYCMPEKIQFKPKAELLTFEEMVRISKLLAAEGIHKIRVTGGEPFLRKDIMHLFDELAAIPQIKKIAVTTNGTHTLQHLDTLIQLGIKTFNLSLDSLDRERFNLITRRDEFPKVENCLHEMLNRNCDVSINAVVMKDHNIEDILPMVAFTEHHDVSMRFIEEMPFNGSDKYYENLEWDYVKILTHIESEFKNVTKLKDPKNSTSLNYKVKGFKGSFGIIPAYTRSFCGTCNRIRITPQGTFKTCLYDNGIFDLRTLMRNGASDAQIITAIKDAIRHKAKDGFAAEKTRNEDNISESMSLIGG